LELVLGFGGVGEAFGFTRPMEFQRAMLMGDFSSGLFIRRRAACRQAGAPPAGLFCASRGMWRLPIADAFVQSRFFFIAFGGGVEDWVAASAVRRWSSCIPRVA